MVLWGSPQLARFIEDDLEIFKPKVLSIFIIENSIKLQGMVFEGKIS